MKTKLIFICCISLALHTFSQEKTSKNTIFLGTGIIPTTSAISIEDNYGHYWNFGYQREILNKLRFESLITTGNYSNNLIQDSGYPIQHFSSTILKTNLILDVLTYKNLSLITGAGINLGFKKGLKSNNIFSEHNIGYNISLGLRWYPYKGKLAYELILVDGVSSFHSEHKELQIMNLRLLFKL